MQYHNSLVGRPPIRSSAFLFVLIGLVWPASAEPPNIGLVYTAEQLGKLEGADGDPLELYKIGRASCRERVYHPV